MLTSLPRIPIVSPTAGNVSAITNKGSVGGASYNLTQGSAPARPAINSATNPLYATFSGDSLVTAIAVASLINGIDSAVVSLYSATGSIEQSLFNQAGLVTGGQINYHPEWSDGSTYLDLPITSARINGNLGTEAADGVTIPKLMLGYRIGASMALHFQGKTTASLSSSTISGSSAGTSLFALGSTSGGTANLNGRIYELVFFRSGFDATTRNQLQGYMAHKAGQHALLDATAIFKNNPPVMSLATF